MNLSQRQLQLLNMLIENNYFVSADDYAQRLFVSSRTIKSDIGVIRTYVNQYNVDILSKRGNGYMLIAMDDRGISNLKQVLSKNTYNFGSFRNDYQQRAYLLYRLVINKLDWFKIEDLANEMNLSRSSINQAMPEVKQRLANFKLELINSPYKGMCLIGSEVAIRAGIIDSFESIYDEESSKYLPQEFYQLKNLNVLTIRDSIIYHFNHQRLSINSILLDKITTAFIVTLLRIKNGYIIKDDLSKMIKDSRMIDVVDAILKENNIEIDREEIMFLAIFCLGYTYPKDTQQIKEYYKKYYDKVSIIIKDMLTYVQIWWHVNVDSGQQKEQLQRILLQNYVLSSHDMFASYFKDAVREYVRISPIMLDLAVRTSLMLANQYKYIISRRLLYSLTLFFEYHYCRNVNVGLKPITIKIVANFDHLIANIYYYFIKNKLMSLIDNVGIVDRFDENDPDSLYIIIDQEFIKARNVINVTYVLKERTFELILREKIIEMYFDFYHDYHISGTDYYVLNKSMSKNELFLLISGLYSSSIEKKMQTYEFITERERIISYENPKNNLAIICLFDQDKIGISLFKLKKPLIFRNWTVEKILVLSINNHEDEIEVFSRVTKHIMLDYENFSKKVKDLNNNQNILPNLIKSSIKY
ncbi:MAG: helix-turn-helix domain-containing protein [Erysipelotrichaceae bacterium]|nr:helix-turn-helix domain-containing protein [Erysipelotrichaceae bacterium]